VPCAFCAIADLAKVLNLQTLYSCTLVLQCSQQQAVTPSLEGRHQRIIYNTKTGATRITYNSKALQTAIKLHKPYSCIQLLYALADPLMQRSRHPLQCATVNIEP
jgi:hypothetical protein